MKKNGLLIFALLICIGLAHGQRYVQPVFTEVEVTADVTYSVNATVLLLAQFQQAVPQELKCDIYKPAGDTETARPLVIVMHTGNFLPPQVNGGCGGTNKDQDVVNVCTRLAKMGYVVAAINYRLGWNPVDPSQTTRVYTLINAAYRGVQDSRACIRFFRKSVAENSNFYGIDPEKIILWGIGTGGYVSYASATLDTISDTYIQKFTTPFGPMVLEPVNGDVDGTKVGITVPGYPGFPVGDTLNYPNHVGYSSNFNLGVNMGGALGDSSWIDENDPPFISFHTPTDPFAPCEQGIVLVPPPVNLPVVDVVGSCFAQRKFAALGLNNCFASLNLDDPISQKAKSLNGGIDGFYPFYSNDPEEGSPWSFTSSLTPYGMPGTPDPCDTNSIKGNTYLDTVMLYFAPRAAACLNLTTSVFEIASATEVGLKVIPNPAVDQVFVSVDRKNAIDDIQLFDLNGRMVQSHSRIRNSEYTIYRDRLAPGMYILKVRIDNKVIPHKVLFR